MPSAESRQANKISELIAWKAKCAKNAAQIVNNRQFEHRLGSDRQSVLDLAPYHIEGMPFDLANKTIAAIERDQLNEAVVDISGAFAKTYEFLKHIIKEETDYNHDPEMQNALYSTIEQHKIIREVLKVYMDEHDLKLDNIDNIEFDHYDEKSMRDNQSYIIIRDYIQLCSSVEGRFNIGE
ncbi:uncharacterized protein LOC135491434 [Lineus longissimus]|uniref:uncharacterized protein LOC135491434 n=1 Tax=Lineus longissimus TaxID=88925 RepID=UPI00315D0261